MKKILCMLLVGILAIGLAGCGLSEKEEKERTLVCTTTENDEDMNIEQVISMTYKNNKLKHMTMEVNTAIINSSIKENWEVYKKSLDEYNKEFDKNGVSLRTQVNDENYEYNIILDIDVENATEEALKEQGFEGIKEDTSTLEESKAEAEKDGAICEIK